MQPYTHPKLPYSFSKFWVSHTCVLVKTRDKQKIRTAHLQAEFQDRSNLFCSILHCMTLTHVNWKCPGPGPTTCVYHEWWMTAHWRIGGIEVIRKDFHLPIQVQTSTSKRYPCGTRISTVHTSATQISWCWLMRGSIVCLPPAVGCSAA